MQFVKHRLGILSICLIIVSGCATIKADQLAKVINDAQTELGTVKASKAEELYPEDFRDADEKFNQAKALSTSLFQRKKAFLYALESIEISKKIMKKILTVQVKPEAEKIKEEVEKKGHDTSLNDLIPKLNDLLSYIDAVAKNEKDVYGLKFAELMKQFDDAKKRKECTVDGILEDDVSFNTGRYQIEYLPVRGIQLLEKFVKESIAAREGCLKKVPNSKVVIAISTFGYTDAQPFTEGTRLIERLEENGECPQQFKERRKCLNLRLSKLRATAIGEYIIRRISESDPNIRVEKEEFAGRGEEIPKGVDNPKDGDPRRRICIIESTLKIKE